jgi:hypothetical protein
MQASSLRLRPPALAAIREATKYRYGERVYTDKQIQKLWRGGILNANNPLWYDAAVNAVATLLNSGFMRIYTGAQPALNVAVTGTLIVTLTFGATAFAASSGGTATANAITSGTASSTNTAGYFALVESGGSVVVATGTCGTASTDLVMNSTSITNSSNVSCSSFTIVG